MVVWVFITLLMRSNRVDTTVVPGVLCEIMDVLDTDGGVVWCGVLHACVH